MSINLNDLGITQQELRNRVVDRLCDRLMLDDEGYDTQFSRDLQASVQQSIDDTVKAIGDKYILPNVEQYIENLTLQETNKWGESKGKQMTFREYLVERAEAYMTEQVNFDGKAKHETSGGFGWKPTQTRLAHMIHQHLHYNIESALKDAVKDANSSIAKGLQETVRLKLNEIAQSIKVQVKTK